MVLPGQIVRDAAHQVREKLSDLGHQFEHRVESVAEKLTSPLRRTHKPPPNDYSHQLRHATEEGIITVGKKKEVTATPDELQVYDPDVPLPKLERLELEEQEQKRAR